MPLTTIYALAGACIVASGADPHEVNPVAAKVGAKALRRTRNVGEPALFSQSFILGRGHPHAFSFPAEFFAIYLCFSNTI